MNLDNDYDSDGNNIVPCPICLDVHCPSKEEGKCPEEHEFVRAMTTNTLEDTTIEKLAMEIAKLFDDGFTTPTFGQIEKIEVLLKNTLHTTKVELLREVMCFTPPHYEKQPIFSELEMHLLSLASRHGITEEELTKSI